MGREGEEAENVEGRKQRTREVGTGRTPRIFPTEIHRGRRKAPTTIRSEVSEAVGQRFARQGSRGGAQTNGWCNGPPLVSVPPLDPWPARRAGAHRRTGTLFSDSNERAVARSQHRR